MDITNEHRLSELTGVERVELSLAFVAYRDHLKQQIERCREGSELHKLFVAALHTLDSAVDKLHGDGPEIEHPIVERYRTLLRLNNEDQVQCGDS
jgi:hypothetical protein